ncbi:hypothetical protein LX64_01902 [Chitinophaga skermanii]|uniref:DUF4177 domain-containing protein n=1 Tax=Chitinophaga skermanii TaxID=331697 RepID=A0A327QSA4_9BACT|nr:DUF4177 domain-containing protein [Chitinophaga skermanii]RAJ06775.1 hypothetical protein LX64_01902 [Chitinophaga skermanii]
MEYKVIPFVASINPSNGTSNHVADQLQELIDNQAVQGWEYIRLESVSTYVQPTAGCFGFGATQGYTTQRQMVVFTRK